MPKGRRLLTNFSKGELSPLMEGRPDLAAYFEGGSVVENWDLLRQGGLRTRAGTLNIAEVKDSSADTILIPFEASVDDSYVLEFGDQYIRFYKNDGTQILTSAGGVPVEVASPYTTAQLRSIHYTQSVDVLFLFHPDVPQRTLSRASDTSWTLATTTYDPPPSGEVDTDISGGSITLTPGATSGSGVNFTASAGTFLAADVGRQIVFGTALATITGYTSTTVVVCTIINNFADTNPIAAGSWLMRLSPQSATLTPAFASPVGLLTDVTASAAAFRSADIGKFLKLHDGVIEIISFSSTTIVVGAIRGVLSATTAAPGGSWTLEENSWSATNGYPRTGEFYAGRLAQASTTANKTRTWLSVVDDFVNYATGVVADDGIEITLASRQLNRIEWITDNKHLFIGTSGAELEVEGASEGAPITADTTPLVSKLATEGCAPIQPVIISKRTIFIDRSRKQILMLGHDSDQEFDDPGATELTLGAEQISGEDSSFRLGPIANQKRPDKRLFFVTEAGVLVTLTFNKAQKVIGFTRYTTDGTFEAVASIPSPDAGKADQVWVIAKRTINSATKRFVEKFDPDHADLSTRSFTGLQTDNATVYNGVSTTSITGLTHLAGETVDVIADASFIGQLTVTAAGVLTLPEAATMVEIGMHYDRTATTMRPAIDGTIIEGLPRSWDDIGVLLKDTIGGKVNGERIEYVPSDLDEKDTFTGNRKVSAQGWDADGRITVLQDQPYPMTLLALYGTLSVGDRA